MRVILASALAGLLASGCGTLLKKTAPPAADPAPVVAASDPAPPPPPPAPPKVVVKTVKAPCVPRNFPRPPRYPDTDKALKEAGGAADRYQLMAAGRLLRIERLAALERALEACR
jgi:uncharacterized membrane protein